MENIEVSIICITYNQEKYIKKALDSFINQRTNFKYEIIVHDDASTDSTSLIIKEYEKKYPNIVRGIYQKENQYTRGINKITFSLFPYVKGEYIALCEGDDYWTDVEKLQKQYDIMVENLDISLCTHKTQCIFEDGEITERIFPPVYFNKNIMDSEEFINLQMIKHYWLFHTSSYFFRTKDITEIINNRPKFIDDFAVGDLCLQLFLITKGNIYYIPEVMSRYRLNSRGSWSEKQKYKDYFENKHLNALNEYDIYTKKKYHVYIENQINYYKFLKLREEKKYKEIFNDKYKSFYKELSRRNKIYYSIAKFFPQIEKIAEGMHRIKKKV